MLDLSDWRQGDLCLGETSIPVLFPEDEVVGFASAGVVVISQTCDIVQPYERKRFVQIARLLPIDPNDLSSVRKFQRPSYLFIPKLAPKNIVADLDVVATVDKSVVVSWARTPGDMTALEQRDFGFAAGRHRSRFAFPDPWADGLKKLRTWVARKGLTAGADGGFINSVVQMRVRGDVSVEQPEALEVICLLPPECTSEDRRTWVQNMLPKMRNMVDSDWCSDVSFILSTTDEMTATDYLSTHRLDFDALTRR